MNFWLILAGLLYAVLFWAVGASRPRIALMLIVAVAPFQNDISGGGPVKFSLAEINILLAVPLVLMKGKMRFGPTVLPALAYIAVGGLCSAAQWRDTTLTCLVQMGIYLVIVVMVFASLARNEEDYRAALTGFVAMGVFFALSVMAFRTPFIYGLHKNGVGASIATAFIVAFELWLGASRKQSRRRFLIAVGILGLGCIMALSRGSWVGAAVGVLIIFALRREFGMMMRTLVVLAPVICAGWMLLPAEDREYATGFQAERQNIRLRYESVDIAMGYFQSSPILGAGVGLRKEYDATNLVLCTLAETGIPGVLTFALLLGSIGALVWRTHRRVPKGSLGFSVVAIAGALSFGKIAHGMVDHYWSRGSLTMAWAAVGMAARTASEAKKRRRRMLLARYDEPSIQGIPEGAQIEPITARESEAACA